MQPSGLVRYDEACRAIAAAKAVDDIKDIRDRAEALRCYARQARNKTLEIDASEIRFRAERRIGELIGIQRDTVGLSVGGRPKPGPARTQFSGPTLAEAGIDKHLADRARTYAAMEGDRFETLLADRRARIELERAHVTVNLVDETSKAERRAGREAELGQKICALPDRKYGLILDDPEWRFDVWSRETGLDRAADNHYPTSPLHEILARDISSIAAEDCVWFRWVTVPFLAHGIRSMDVGGFVYKSNYVWGKPVAGTGFWNRNKHEHLLIAVRGHIPCPAPGTQWDSLQFAPPGDHVGVHSAKPKCFLDMIEGYFPTLPKIELNRRGPARPGWDAWGNEAEIETVA